MSLLLTPPFQPFTIAGAVVLGLVLIEIVTTATGAPFSSAIQSIATFEFPPASEQGAFGRHLRWLNPGLLPLVILVTVGLAGFAVSGFVLQTVATMIRAPLPVFAAISGALVASLPIIRWGSSALTRLMPRTHGDLALDRSFIGRVAVVQAGPVKEGSQARIRVQDEWGTWHFPRARPAKPGDELPTGSKVLIVDRIGREFAVIGIGRNASRNREGASPPSPRYAET